jgi:Polyketide cyclase / dehydrase and lipid transport
MVELNHEIIINSAPEKVWKVLADLEAVQHYNRNVLKARYISSNREGIGASRECDVKPKGKVKERVTGWDPGRSMTLELYESDWPVRNMHWTTELRSESGSTKVSQRLFYEPKGLVGAILNVLILKHMMNKNLSEVFLNLKQYVEKGE